MRRLLGMATAMLVLCGACASTTTTESTQDPATSAAADAAPTASQPEPTTGPGPTPTVATTSITEPTPADDGDRSPDPGDDDATGDAAVDATNDEPGAPGTTTPPDGERNVAEARRQPGPASGNIRDVDFANDFVHLSDWGDEPIGVNVADGVFLWNTEFGAESLSIGDPTFGDLDGDGLDEAVVRTAWNGGGSGIFDAVAVYRIDDGDVVLAARQLFGDRAFGGVWNVDIIDGLVVVDSFANGQGSCCPTEVVRERFRVDADSTSLVIGATSTPLRWLSFANAVEPPELRFLPSTSAAVLAVPDGEHTLTFDAAAGQVLSVNPANATAESVKVTLIGIDGGAQELVGASTLDSAGPWSLVFENPLADQPWASIVVAIDAAAAPGYRVLSRTEVVQSEPDITARATYPVIDGQTWRNATAAIEAWVDDEITLWTNYAEESLPLPNPEQGGNLDIAHQLTLVSPTLVSVEFAVEEYLCCRPRPNSGFAAVNVDPTDGRVVADNDLVDVSRLLEIEAIWLTRLAAEWPELGAEGEILPASPAGEPRWDSLAVRPDGLVFGTTRLGAIPATSTFVPFGDLGNLVRPSTLESARSGVRPSGF